MKLGLDMHHNVFLEDPYKKLPLEEKFRLVKQYGTDGMYFKSPMYLSETLDRSELNYYLGMAREMGLYLDFGIGRINPYNTTETSRVWALSGGDYLKAVELQIIACAEMGCTEFIAACAGGQGARKGYFGIDRFRTDVTWEDQLIATEKFLKLLIPVLRDTGTKVAIETHEEITTFEILRLIENVGEDYICIAYDTGNVIGRGEEPVAVAKRIAPYVTQMHARDCVLYFTDRGINAQIRACGEGMVNFKEIFDILSKHNNNIRIHLEDFQGTMEINLYEETWRKSYYEAKPEELFQLVKYANSFEKKIAAKELMDPAQYDAIPYEDQCVRRTEDGIAFLRKLL